MNRTTPNREIPLEYRIENDSLGELEIPNDFIWGAQTQRAVLNFRIGREEIGHSMIFSLVNIKKACAIANCILGELETEKKRIDHQACNEILTGEYNDQFPVSIWQSGSGTQSNMNVNEVISNLCSKHSGNLLGSKIPVHPNDDVNRSQSSNDVFSTAMHLSALNELRHKLLPELQKLIEELQNKVEEFSEIVKVGRTHLMDAVPLTLGQEFSGYVEQLTSAGKILENHLTELDSIALGGSAVGTGINTHPKFAETVAHELSVLTGEKLKPAKNKFSAIASNGPLVSTSGGLKRLSTALFKMANDIRWMASGPHCGLGELSIPANEPGSSIMPGKINPTQCESMIMVCIQVMGNDSVISICDSQGNFELNVCKPVIIHNLLQSVELLSDSMKSFRTRCVAGLVPNRKHIEAELESSMMTVTALSKILGYDKAAEVVYTAEKDGETLKKTLRKMKLLDEEEIEEVLNPLNMTHP